MPRALVRALQQVVLGQDSAVERLVAALLAGGHVLLDDVPGVGKTLMARSVAALLDLPFRRVQFSPDMMPSDVTGSSLYHPPTGEFRFVPGPLFTHVLLADEINRASPRTQSALLEAMEEARVTVDGVTRDLPEPFWVIATQNPVEFQGTFPLPEAQLDRFAVILSLGYPAPEHEQALLGGPWARRDAPALVPVADAATLARWQREVLDIRVDASLQAYMVRIAGRSRTDPRVALGISPRGSLTWQRMAQAWALLRGRSHVTPDDVQAVAVQVLAHRVVLRDGGDRRDRERLVTSWLAVEPVPV